MMRRSLTTRIALAAVVGLLCAGCSSPVSDGGPSTSPTSSPSPFKCPATAFRLGAVNVTIATSAGDIGLVLHGARSPITVCNFLQYVQDDYYDNTIWHRICAGFVIQAGGLTTVNQYADVPIVAAVKPARAPIHNEEPESQLRNLQGTIAMARESGADTATTHFFLNLVDNTRLDWDGPVAPGYAVFGNVTSGWNVVQDIADTPVLPSPMGGCDGHPVPSMETTINDIRIG